MSARTPVYPSPFVEGDAIGPVENLDGSGSGTKRISSVTKVMGSDTDYKMDRDPNALNPHLQIMWDDVVGEPEGLRSPDSCWNCSRKCYDGSRTCCYRFLVILFGPLIALINGCSFACLSFNQVWCVGPCYRHFKITMATYRNFWVTFLMAVMSPLFAVCGILFNNIKVRYQKLDDGVDKEPQDHFNI
ncbi:Caveolin [Trinorchestia longiramus]|nr:Caveolin [Trinorchestia longiramus]